MKNTKAKGPRLEAKSLRYLSDDGARHIFTGDGHLIAVYAGWNRAVYVATPRTYTRIRKHLERMNLPKGWHKEVHVWPDGWKTPIVEVVTAK